MLSKLKVFKVFGRLSTGKKLNGGEIYAINGLHNMLFQPFGNSAHSIEVEVSEKLESPEIPGWLKFCENENSVARNPDEDFVLPSISYWFDSHMLQDTRSEAGVVSSDSDSDKLSKILKNRFESPDDVIEALDGCNITLSESLVEKMLKRFSTDWKQAFGFFKWAESQMGCRHSPELYNLMVDNLGKTRKFDLMNDLVEHMERLNGGVTFATTYNVMRRFAKARRYEEAKEVFRRLERHEVSKDRKALNLLMDVLVKENSVEDAYSVYLEFKNLIPPDLCTFNILIHGWCKARQLDKAESTLEEMREHGFCPNVFSYTAFVEAHCKEKDFRKVDEILEEMQEKGCPANVVTYTIIMHSLGKAKQVNEALEVYEKMKRNGCVPDSSFYSSLIYILSKAGRLKDARELFEDMPKQGVNPCVLTYNTMITMACQHSQEEDALVLLQKMEENHCMPDLNTYAPLLKMCCRLKRMRVLAFLLNHMYKNNVNVELGIYSLLIHGLCRSGLLEHACAFFEEAVLRGFIPRDDTYGTVVKELAKKGMLKAKAQIEELMSQTKQKPVT